MPKGKPNPPLNFACLDRHAEAIRILRRVYTYLNRIRGMAFVGIEHPSEIQAMIDAFLDEETDA